tara:strand:+ start:789 stop:1493 length:705 start_codon:yes stop_codon:yes gene_type:complete
MNPVAYGYTQCFNVDSQCFSGAELTTKLNNDPTIKDAFTQSCKINNPKNRIIRCCPVNLMNEPYIPRIGTVPVHVKRIGNNFKQCPQKVKSQCIRVRDPEQRILCIAGKCNDAGFLEAENYYQVCKSIKDDVIGEEIEIPDCPIRKCNKMMEIPEELIEKLKGIKPEQVIEQCNCLPCNLAVPEDPKSKDLNLQDEITLKGLVNLLPKENSFYNWGSFILGIIAMAVLIVIILS